jgi:metal-dependent amidase/aminoacylase/carboxypeptidase family protein
MAWQVPASMANAKDAAIVAPQGSKVLSTQRSLAKAMRKTSEAVVADVQAGLAETVGVGATLNEEERTSVVIRLPTLPEGITPEYIAQAIDAENVEAWCDKRGQVHVAISPWYSTKDVDQVVLSITKVVHVKLGLHATGSLANENAGFWRRWVSAAMEIAAMQKQQNRR